MSFQIPVLYGTETGNAEYCAEILVAAIEKEGVSAAVVNMEDFSFESLEEQSLVFIITSTYGNGDPPENAIDFLEYVQNEDLELNNVRFAVCALGDKSFSRFAQCGKDFEAAFLKNNAIPIFDRVDCDGDFEFDFEFFQQQAIEFIRNNKDNIDSAGGSQQAESTSETVVTEATGVGRDRPFKGILLEKRLLSSAGSKKETMHYDVLIEASEMNFRVGDCFGLYPTNSDTEVENLLKTVGSDGSEWVSIDGKNTILFDSLKSKCLTHVGLRLVEEIKSINHASGDSFPLSGLGGEELKSYLENKDVAEVIQENGGAKLQPQQLVDNLRKLQPRLYSVASSPTKNINRVSFTVETIRFEKSGRLTGGVASCWLADRLQEGDVIPLYLVKNDAFQFPADNTPVIMIGPGTGIAPFRAYLEEVEAAKINNKTWLFFGHQHHDKDFLYKDEIQKWQQNGVLSKISLAWSRDQEHKIYVQDRIKQHGAEVWSWIEAGAKVYVCGDAHNMAPAVAQTFCELALQYGGVADGRGWLQKMIDESRFLTDVY